MRDVAALAGVSVKTVSRVVNLEPHIRPETLRRVRAAIEELGWLPHTSARTLRTGRTGIIGVGVPDLRQPDLAALVNVLVEEIARNGMHAAVEPTHDRPERLRNLLEARGETFDGIVTIGPIAPELMSSIPATEPLVSIQAATVGTVDGVETDPVEAASLVARHLAVMGRSRPVLLGYERITLAGQAMLRALRAEGIGPPLATDGRVRTRSEGFEAARHAVATWPQADAIVCARDTAALGALAALAAAGVCVPDEVAVIGNGALDDGRFTTPSLTTVNPGRARMARAAMDLLTERLSGAADAQPRRILTPVELVRRESTLGPGLP